MESEGSRPRRGRPPKGGEAKRASFNTRLRDSLKAQLERAAAEAGRSLSEEIEFRLEESFLMERALVELESRFQEFETKVSERVSETGRLVYQAVARNEMIESRLRELTETLKQRTVALKESMNDPKKTNEALGTTNTDSKK